MHNSPDPLDPPDPNRRHVLARLAGWAACSSLLVAPIGAAARPSGTPMPLLLAADAPADPDPRGWLVSEKYDGVRALWDGRQLRFRSGLTVAAPGWFLAALPAVPLDGELWLGRGRFDALSGLVRSGRLDDAQWHALRYMAFELPGAPGRFDERARRLRDLAAQQPQVPWQAAEQFSVDSASALQRRLAQVVAAGGEGLMLHRADAPCETGRSGALLKLKPLNDADAVVLAHLPGRGRHQGRMGALLLRTDDGAEFALGTGFSDALREAPPPPGSVVTYTHRGYTSKGLPRFASFLRVRPTGA